MNSPSEPWEARYQAGTTGWDRGTTSPQLHHWLESNTLKPCRILVPGCGNGYEVLALAKAGFNVVAVDIAPSPLNKLREQLTHNKLNAKLVQADLLDWQPNHPFDAIYEQTSLCALAPKHWPRYALQLHRWLRVDGLLFALFMQTNKPNGPPFHCALEEMDILFPTLLWAWSNNDNQVPHPAGFHELAFQLRRL